MIRINLLNRKSTFPKKLVILESIPSLGEILRRYDRTGELSVTYNNTGAYDFDSNYPKDINAIEKDKTLIDAVVSSRKILNSHNIDSDQSDLEKAGEQSADNNEPTP